MMNGEIEAGHFEVLQPFGRVARSRYFNYPESLALQSQ